MNPINTGTVTVIKDSMGFWSDGWDRNIPCGAIDLGNENLSLIYQSDSCKTVATQPGEHVPDVYPNSIMTKKIQVDSEIIWILPSTWDTYNAQCVACCSPIPTLANPANLTGTPGDTEAVLAWDDVTNATNYIVEQSADNSFNTVTQVYSGSVSGYTDTGLTNGTPYYCRVKAQAAGYNDSGWAYVSVTPSA